RLRSCGRAVRCAVLRRTISGRHGFSALCAPDAPGDLNRSGLTGESSCWFRDDPAGLPMKCISLPVIGLEPGRPLDGYKVAGRLWRFCGRIRGRILEVSMPLLLLFVLPFTLWSAFMDSISPPPL